MRISQTWAMAVLILGAIALGAPAQTARADDLKIAVCNPLDVVLKSKEYSDLQEKAKADGLAYEQGRTERENKIKAFQDDLKLTIPTSTHYSELEDQLLNASIEYDVWVKRTEMDLMRKQKDAIKKLFDKVQAATADVAQKNGINLVITEKRPDLHDDDMNKIDLQQLMSTLLQRTVLYVDTKLDITDQVVVVMNNAYDKH